MIDIDQAVAMFAALANETAFDIVRLLVERESGELTSSEISIALKAPLRRVARQVQRLKDAAIVTSRDDRGGEVFALDLKKLNDLKELITVDRRADRSH
jgi:DNA-binding transcriptional ArsR family regulator